MARYSSTSSSSLSDGFSARKPLPYGSDHLGYTALGYTDRVQEQWNRDREFDPTRVYKNEIAGGPLTHSYENLVKNIFRPEQTNGSGPPLPPSFASPGDRGGPAGRILASQSRPKISAAAMKRVEDQLGRDALDDTYDDQLWKSPLDEVYKELGIGTTPSLASASTAPSFAVYAPKSSVEYFSTASAPPSISSHRSSTLGTYRLGAPSSLRPLSSAGSGRAEDEHRWRSTDRQTLLDYKDTSSQSPFSAHLYQPGGVQRQDTRIVGSNFVQLTTRPKDRFLEKLDKTLADIRAEPRYNY